VLGSLGGVKYGMGKVIGYHNKKVALRRVMLLFPTVLCCPKLMQPFPPDFASYAAALLTLNLFGTYLYLGAFCSVGVASSC